MSYSSQFSPTAELDLEGVPTWETVQKLVWKSKPHLKREYWLYLALLAYTGARRNEILDLHYEDMILEGGEIVGVKIHQEKKGDKKLVRRVPVTKKIRNELTDFVVENRTPGDDEEDRGDRIFDFSTRTANNIVSKYAAEQVLGRHITPHDLRHAFTFKMLREKKDLETVRRLTGHSGYKILKVYLSSSQMDLEPELEAAIADKIEDVEEGSEDPEEVDVEELPDDETPKVICPKCGHEIRLRGS